ncbi:imidazoleglycerol-phosphate dehydratase [Orobanche gracilis]
MDLSIRQRSGGNHTILAQSRPSNSPVQLSQRVLLPVHLQRRKVQLLSTKITAPPMESTIPRVVNKDSPSTITSQVGRVADVKRATKETNVNVKINLDGDAIADNNTGIPFLDHMLDQLASHGLFDVDVKATGDIHIDDHHTNEDVALAIGTALLQALGDRKGINRFGDFSASLDEALVHVSLLYPYFIATRAELIPTHQLLLKPVAEKDLSGRPHLSYDLRIPTERVGTYDTQLVEHFFQSLVNTSGMTLHIRQLAGRNTHHIIEATFKAFARALRQATEYDPRRRGNVPRARKASSPVADASSIMPKVGSIFVLRITNPQILAKETATSITV